MFALVVFIGATGSIARAQSEPSKQTPGRPFSGETTQDYNRRLQELAQKTSGFTATAREYRIGPEDLLELAVLDAPDLSRTLRVSAGGEISIPLLGAVKAAGLTPRELELVLQELLRRSYMKDPHVGVFVREMQSHSVSIVGAVKKPGLFQIRGTKTLLEMLSMAEGLAENAGDTVYVMRGEGWPEPAIPAAAKGGGENSPRTDGAQSSAGASVGRPGGSSQGRTLVIDLKELLESGDSRNNVAVYPGDTITVSSAGIIYVVGEVRKPGGFLLRTNENVSVLQAIALGEGLTRTAAVGRARIIRTEVGTGRRLEIAVDLGRVLAGKAGDPTLHPKDILYVPNSKTKSAFFRAGDAAVSIVSGVIIWRR